MTGDPLGAVLLVAAPLGIAGVFVLALIERLTPLIPSSGLFAAIGVAAADGLWCLPFAMLASVLGSGTGAFSTYRVGAIVGRDGGARFRRFLRRRDRSGRMLRALRRRGAAHPFTAQLFPATRTLAPLIGGAVPHDRQRFLLGTVAGLTVWNVAFIGLGYAVVWLGGHVNVTAVSVALAILGTCLTIAMRFKRAKPRQSRVPVRHGTAVRA
jgi:membrane protein DedA with SNARE-associated domain